MLQYTYKAKKDPQNTVTGTIEAENIDAALQKILKQGLIPFDIAPLTATTRMPTGARKKLRFFSKIKFKDVVMFTQQLADLTDAAVPLLKSLQLIEHQTVNPQFQEVVHTMYEIIRDGGSLAKALSAHTD